MTAADSFPTLAAHADAPFAYREPLGRQCREALLHIDLLAEEVERLREVVAELEAMNEELSDLVPAVCTPAERALIDAVLAWRPVPDARPFCGTYRDMLHAADAVLAERGEA